MDFLGLIWGFWDELSTQLNKDTTNEGKLHMISFRLLFIQTIGQTAPCEVSPMIL